MKQQRVTLDVPEGSIMAWLLKPRSKYVKPPPLPPRPRYTREQRERGIV